MRIECGESGTNKKMFYLLFSEELYDDNELRLQIINVLALLNLDNSLVKCYFSVRNNDNSFREEVSSLVGCDLLP